METVIAILIIALVVWFAFWLIDTIGIADPFGKIIKVVIAILAIIKVISYLA